MKIKETIFKEVLEWRANCSLLEVMRCCHHTLTKMKYAEMKYITTWIFKLSIPWIWFRAHLKFTQLTLASGFTFPWILQDVLLKSSLDSIFKVGFGVELNSLSGSDDFGNQFTKAFDDSNFIVYCRYVDVFWELKRYLNIGMEASLKRNIKLIDSFIFELIRCKREQMKNVELDVSNFFLNTDAFFYI